MSKQQRVLQFICSTGFYGAERWILALCKHLPTHIHSELAVTSEPENQNLQITAHWRELGLTAHEIPMQNRFDLSVINKLVELCKARQIDVIHTHGYKSDILGVIAAKKAGIKVVVTPHGFENASDWKLRTFIYLGCQAMRFADKVVPLSPALCEDVKALGIKAPTLEYIQNGVDLSEVEAVRNDAEFDAATDKKRIGFIGQMISRKNCPALLRIFDNIHQQLDGQVELYLLGDGDARAMLETQAAGLNSHNDIHFLGFRDDRLALLKTFDLFVMSSSLEGIPRCLMEACAMGTPIAAYHIDGIDQLITHEKTGLLAAFDDEAGLLQHWLTLLNDADYAHALGENARQFVHLHFSAQRMANEYAELFQTMQSKDEFSYA